MYKNMYIKCINLPYHLDSS